MIGISRLYCQTAEAADNLRYASKSDRKPVVVFNCTQQCNLQCAHCYADSGQTGLDELNTAEAFELIDDISSFGSPAVLFSGGEPLLRNDIFELIQRAANGGLRTALSTNGTLIDSPAANKLAHCGLHYAGISIDGPEEVHDEFRGRRGAFQESLAGMRNCRQAGIKVGLRTTMTQRNFRHIGWLFSLLEDENIPRICFYHLVSAGRGRQLNQQTLNHDQTRETIDEIMNLTAAAHERGRKIEVLTVDNHADGPYLYMRLLKENPNKAGTCLELLKRNGGNASGIAIAAISADGQVYPDQFWRNQILGNVREKPFSKIWTDDKQPMLAKLRKRRGFLTGRCVRCRWMDICNGNLRVRAETAGNGIWGDDPACYLTDEEIAP